MNDELRQEPSSSELSTQRSAPAKPASRELIKCLQTLWPKVSASLAGDDVDERTLRLRFSSDVIGRPLDSFSDLSMDEGVRLLERFKQETGEEFKPVGHGKRRRQKPGARSQKVSAEETTRIGMMAVELFGGRWMELLSSRCADRFQNQSLSNLTPRQGRMLVEELLQRLAVEYIRTGRVEDGNPNRTISRDEIEAYKGVLRKRFFNHRGTEAESK